MPDHAVGHGGALGGEDRRRQVGEGDDAEPAGRGRVEPSVRHAGTDRDRRRQVPAARGRRHGDDEEQRVLRQPGHEPPEERVRAPQGPYPRRFGDAVEGEAPEVGGAVEITGVDDHDVGSRQRQRRRREHTVGVGAHTERRGRVGDEEVGAVDGAGVDPATAVGEGNRGRARDARRARVG